LLSFILLFPAAATEAIVKLAPFTPREEKENASEVKCRWEKRKAQKDQL